MTKHVILAVAVLLGACRSASGPAPSTDSSAASAPRYEVYAVRFATLTKFPLRSLVAGAPRTDSLDIAMSVWVIRGGGRTILVDAGFYRDKFMRQWHPADYHRPDEALSAFRIQPSDVTDVIISHIHWDHADGADLFPKANVWLQREEYEYYVTDSGTVKNRAIDPDDAPMLHAIRKAGRIRLIDGDARAVYPGITAYTGGKHTYASEYVGVNTRSGTVILASDNAYLYYNLEQKRPIAQTLDSLSNMAAHARMLRLAAKRGPQPLIVPGHDPSVFAKFPLVRPGVARID